MHQDTEGYHRATLATQDEQIAEWIERYKEAHNASDSQAIQFAIRQQLQLEEE